MCVRGAESREEQGRRFDGRGARRAVRGHVCVQCGPENTLEFTLDPETSPLDAYGGDKPSQIICPG